MSDINLRNRFEALQNELEKKYGDRYYGHEPRDIAVDLMDPECDYDIKEFLRFIVNFDKGLALYHTSRITLSVATYRPERLDDFFRLLQEVE